MPSKNDWYRDNRAYIESQILADASNWLHSFDQGFDGYLDLDGRPHELKGTGKDKGKVAYVGSINARPNGRPYISLTLINQHASVPNEVYKGSGEVVDSLWEDYKRGDEAVDTLLDSPQDPPRNWDEFKLNLLGKKSFLEKVDNVAKQNYRLGNSKKVFEAIKTAITPHSNRLGIDDSLFSNYAYGAIDNAFKSLKYRLAVRYKAKLAVANQTVNIDRDLKGIKLDHKTTVIESGLGTGKTQWLKENIFKNPDIKTALDILPRIALAKESSNRLEAANYEDIKAASPQEKHDMDTDKIVCVSNSLELLNVILNFPDDKVFDAIVLDESELNIHHFFGETFSVHERKAMLDILKRWIKNAKYVICCQAQITSLTIDFLKACGREDIHVIRNEYQRYGVDRKDENGKPIERLPVDIYSQKADCEAYLEILIDKNEPVIVPCTSAKFARGLALELRAKYPKLKILQIDSNNCHEPEQAAFLANANRNAKKWDIVIHSPTLEQGVSIDVPHFRHVVGFCDAGNGIGAPDSFVQMMFRSRHLDRAAIWVEPRVEYKPTDYKQILLEQAARYGTAVASVEVVGNRQYEISVKPFRVDDNIILAAKSKAAEQAAKNRTLEEVYAILDYMGCDINLIEGGDKPNEAGVAALKDGKIRQNDEHNERVIAAQQITPSRYKEILNSSKPTLEESYEAKRHKLESTLAIDLNDLNEDEIKATAKLWNQGKAKKTIQALGEAALSPKHAIAVTKHLLATKPQNSEAHGFWTRWLIRAGIFESLHIRFNKGVFEFDEDFWFTYEYLRGSWWYKWACENKDAVNGSGLGARIKGTTDKAVNACLNAWMRAMGIRLTSKLVDAKSLNAGDLLTNTGGSSDKKGVKPKGAQEKLGAVELSDNIGGDGSTPLVYIYKNKKEGSIQKRDRVRTYQVDAKAMQTLTDVLERRCKAGTMPWVRTAQDYLETQVQDAARDGLTIKEPDLARTVIRTGLLESLHIKRTDDGFECDPPRLRRGDFVFRYEDLAGEPWYQWACEHKDEVNAADLGAQFTGDAPSPQVISKWIKAMGIVVQSKKIDAHKLLINKGCESDTLDNTGDVPLPTGKFGGSGTSKENRGVCKKVSEKRELIRVYSVNPKSMKKLCDTLGVKPDEQVKPVEYDTKIEQSNEPPIEAYAQYTPDDIEQVAQIL
jgi:hypothetical protein